MNDGIVKRTVRQGTKTQSVDTKPRSKKIRGDIKIWPDEVELAVEMAREMRIEQDIREYAHRKAAA